MTEQELNFTDIIKLIEELLDKIRHKHPPQPPAPTPTPTPAPTVQILGTVDVINFSTTDSDATVKSWVDAVKIQADRDISKFWTYSVDFNIIPKDQKPNTGHWYAGFFDNSDQAGVLGWHDEGPNHEPLIKVFTKTSEGFGESPSIAFSHEIAESIGDPSANITVHGFDESGKPVLYFRENCDPVEAFTYDINGVKVSDFITPAWFVAGSTAQLDYLKLVNKPFQILQGGYMLESYDGGATWTEVDKFSKRTESHRSAHSRYSLYKRPSPAQRVRSTFETQ